MFLGTSPKPENDQTKTRITRFHRDCAQGKVIACAEPAPNQDKNLPHTRRSPGRAGSASRGKRHSLAAVRGKRVNRPALQEELLALPGLDRSSNRLEHRLVLDQTQVDQAAPGRFHF
jgi:hypothetical protein